MENGFSTSEGVSFTSEVVSFFSEIVLFISDVVLFTSEVISATSLCGLPASTGRIASLARVYTTLYVVFFTFTAFTEAGIGEGKFGFCLHLQSLCNQWFAWDGEGVKAKNSNYCRDTRVRARRDEGGPKRPSDGIFRWASPSVLDVS